MRTGVRSTLDKSGKFVTSQVDYSEEEEELIPVGGVGEIPPSFVQTDEPLLSFSFLEDSDDEDEVEDVDVDDLLAEFDSSKRLMLVFLGNCGKTTYFLNHQHFMRKNY